MVIWGRRFYKQTNPAKTIEQAWVQWNWGNKGPSVGKDYKLGQAVLQGNIIAFHPVDEEKELWPRLTDHHLGWGRSSHDRKEFVTVAKTRVPATLQGLLLRLKRKSANSQGASKKTLDHWIHDQHTHRRPSPASEVKIIKKETHRQLKVKIKAVDLPENSSKKIQRATVPETADSCHDRWVPAWHDNEIEKEKQHYRQRGTERGKALRQRRILHGKGLRNHSVPQ